MIALEPKYDMTMENTDQSQKHTLQQHLVLDELKTVFCDCFEGLVDDCCYRLEIDFGIQLGQKRTQIDKDAYSHLLQSLKQQKPDIKKAYLQQVLALFESTQVVFQAPEKINILNAQLAKDESVEEDFILKKIVRNTNHLFLEDIHKLNNKIAAWAEKRVISEVENPVCPANLVRALVAVVSKLDVQTEYKVALYKVFDEKVFSQLGFIYVELNKIKMPSSVTLIKSTNNEESEKPQSEVAGNINQQNESFQKLQNSFVEWRADNPDSAYIDMSTSYDELDETYQLYEINNALEIIRQFAEVGGDDDLKDAAKPIKWLVKQKLDDFDPQSSTKRLARNDEDILDLIAYLFQHIENESSIAEPLRASLLKLKYSLSGLTLSQYGFLFDLKGVGRQLLDVLYEESLFIDLNDHAGQLIKKKIDTLISRIFTDRSCGSDEIKDLLDDFVIFSQKNKKRCAILQQRTIQLVKNKEKLALSKQFVNREIIQCIQGQPLPEKVSCFLLDVWQGYLLLIYLRKDEEPEIWLNAVDAMKNLVRSVNPPKDDIERKEILKLLPALIKELRTGLKRISYDKHSQSAFFKELAVFHVLLMNKNELQVRRSDVEVSIATIDDMVEQYELKEDESYTKITEIKLGQWLTFKIDSVFSWGQLVWRSEETDSYLFTDKQGKKLMEVPLKELLEYFKNDQVAVTTFYNRPFTEHVFNQL